MRKSLQHLLYAIVFVLIIFLVLPASDGLVVEIRISKNENQSRNVFYFQKDKLKIVTEDISLIFLEDQLCILDNEQKIFWKGKSKEFDKALILHRLGANSIYSAKSSIFQQDLPEKYKYHPKNKSATIVGKEDEIIEAKIYKTPDFISIAGYASRRFEIKEDDELVEEVWISDNLKHYVNYELNLELYQDFMRSYFLHSESKLYYHLGSFMEIVKNGFPMKINMYRNGVITETRVENLIKKRNKDSVFMIPEDFKECNLKDVLN
ncbi:DUF4412 domain-containing protein [Labilibaculum sp.]|uniref:DUF4412 domain-containing protein n=1 Tax=Labilibaculum sp. TaxID=2060723 RepID=UPI0035669B14